METAADRYRRLRTAFADTIIGVPDDAWSNPTPCEGWSAREVAAHVVDTQGMFEGLVGRTLDPGPDVADDPLEAFRVATDQVQAHLDDPATADEEFDGFSGRTTFAAAVDGFLCMDLVVHRWDLARATGGDERIEPGDIAWVRERAAQLGDTMRSRGAFGPEIEPPAEATEEQRLMAFLGRSA